MLENSVRILGSMSEDNRSQIAAMADALAR